MRLDILVEADDENGEKEKINVAKRMLEKKIDIKIIMEVTKLSEDEIKEQQ